MAIDRSDFAIAATGTVSHLRLAFSPATWAMMLVGIGAIGAAMRRRTKVAVSFA